MAKISVIGDIIEDEYIYGICERISPEAPVPVVKFQNKETKPGGALNVFYNIKSLTDNVEFCTESSNPPKKTRVMANGHYLLRIDYEDQNCGWQTNPSYLESDIIVVSDYLKGAVETFSFPLTKKLIVDPKRHLSFYKGAWCIKPNRKEFEQVVGKWNSYDELKSKMFESAKQFGFEHLIVTLGEDGVAYVNDQNFYHIPSDAQEVFDVTGAGDTFTAVLAYGVLTGMTVLDSIKLANRASGIAVKHHGTYIITKEDLGIINRKKKVFTNGCFDVLHRGHIEYLKASKQLGDYLIVGINSDSSVKRLKGPARPINNQEDRKYMLEQLGFIDQVIIFEEDTPYELIKKELPDLITKGGDYSVEDVVGNDLAEVVIIPFTSGYSTTSIVKRIKNET